MSQIGRLFPSEPIRKRVLSPPKTEHVGRVHAASAASHSSRVSKIRKPLLLGKPRRTGDQHLGFCRVLSQELLSGCNMVCFWAYLKPRIQVQNESPLECSKQSPTKSAWTWIASASLNPPAPQTQRVGARLDQSTQLKPNGTTHSHIEAATKLYTRINPGPRSTLIHRNKRSRPINCGQVATKHPQDYPQNDGIK